MSSDLAWEQLRDRTDEVLARVEAGEQLRITKDGEVVAHLAPARRHGIPRERFLANLVQADPALRDELNEMLGPARLGAPEVPPPDRE